MESNVSALAKVINNLQISKPALPGLHDVC